jgi:hypothetical protein
MYCKTGKANNSEATEETKQDAPAPLYLPGIKIGGPHETKITCGIKGKSMPCKTKTKKLIKGQALPIPIFVQMGEQNRLLVLEWRHSLWPS